MNLDDLEDLIDGLGIDPKPEDLNRIYEIFKKDFIDKEFTIDRLKVKVILKNSCVRGYESYPETFVHLITRKSISGKRVFDKKRANKIHWIRCVLENRTNEGINYFELTESKNKKRDYYWFRDKDFIVIMEKLSPDYFLITSFTIDDEKNRKYYLRKYQQYRRTI